MTKGEEACVTLKEYVDSLVKGLDHRITETQTNAKEAVKIATEAQDKRINLLNEFRKQSEDQEKRFAPLAMVLELTNQVSKIWGGLVVVALVGIANLVKLFFTH